MISYILFNWDGQLKWADYAGCFLVDPAHEREFLATIADARLLPINTNIF